MTHPLVDIRHHQHNGETDWLSVAQEAIVQVLRKQDTVHANDLYELGLPDEACNVAGSAFASLVAKGWTFNTEERRASTRPSRNCGKSFVYRATSKFPATVGVGGGTSLFRDGHRATPHSGGAGVDAGGGFASLPSVAASVHPGDKGCAGDRSPAIPAEPSPLSLFELPPINRHSDERAA